VLVFRGFAFVVFGSDEVLASVLEKDHVVKGKKVAVKKAASKQVRTCERAHDILHFIE
jgi:hypothetical protein